MDARVVEPLAFGPRGVIRWYAFDSDRLRGYHASNSWLPTTSPNYACPPFRDRCPRNQYYGIPRRAEPCQPHVYLVRKGYESVSGMRVSSVLFATTMGAHHNSILQVVRYEPYVASRHLRGAARRSALVRFLRFHEILG